MATKRNSVTQKEALFPAPARRAGRVEAAVARSIRQAWKSGELDPLDAGACALTREAARSVDVAAAKPDPYAVATVSRELRELLARLGLDPRSRNLGPTDELAAALADLARPSSEDQPAP